MITRTDFTALLAYVQGLVDWILAAEGCLKGQASFADEVGAFLRGGR